MAFDARHAVTHPVPARKTTLARWGPLLNDPPKRAALGRDLAALLAPEVTARLPADLAFDQARDAVDRWIETADGLADIHTITRTDTGALAGLLLLFAADPAHDTDLMIGYFLGPEHWGQGLASDMLSGLVEQLDRGPRRQLFAGTDAGNKASQRVLEKAGFTRIPDESTPDRAAFSRRCGG